MDDVGTAASAAPSPQATVWRRCYHDTVPPLLDVRHLNIEFAAAALRRTVAQGTAEGGCPHKGSSHTGPSGRPRC